MQIKQGDTLPRVREELDTEMSLEGATVWFKMQADDGAMLVDSEATIEDADSGEVSYQFADGETDRTGTHRAEWVVEWASDRETNPRSHFADVEIVESLDRNAAPVAE